MACTFRPALCAAAVVSLLSLAGCSGPSGDPTEQANEYVSEVNGAIEEHNRLYEEARGTYEEARESVESGGDPSEEVENVTQARETLEEARGSLLEAREPLAGVQNLEDVEPDTGVDDAYLTHEICLAADVSAEERRPVRLPMA